MLNVVKTEEQYCVQVTSDQMRAILHHEQCGYPPLFKALNRLRGVSKTNYDGHFGPFIWFNVSVLGKSDLKAQALQVIEKYLKEAWEHQTRRVRFLKRNPDWDAFKEEFNNPPSFVYKQDMALLAQEGA